MWQRILKTHCVWQLTTFRGKNQSYLEKTMQKYERKGKNISSCFFWPNGILNNSAVNILPLTINCGIYNLPNGQLWTWGNTEEYHSTHLETLLGLTVTFCNGPWSQVKSEL